MKWINFDPKNKETWPRLYRNVFFYSNDRGFFVGALVQEDEVRVHIRFCDNYPISLNEISYWQEISLPPDGREDK